MATLSEILARQNQYQGSIPAQSLANGIMNGIGLANALNQIQPEQTYIRESGAPEDNGVIPMPPSLKPDLNDEETFGRYFISRFGR